jgi:hypothetical protein
MVKILGTKHQLDFRQNWSQSKNRNFKRLKAFSLKMIYIKLIIFIKDESFPEYQCELN